jgi:formylglycine-generating enzyme
MNRYYTMIKFLTIFLLPFFSIGSFAQSEISFPDKSALEKLAPLIFIPAKTFKSLVHEGNDTVTNYSPRMVSVPNFYMSATEVSNSEYRDFIYYIRDSIAHRFLGHLKKDNTSIDWDQKINWSDPRLDVMMTSPEDRIFGKKEIDPVKLNYEINFFGQNEIINVYPDTLAWIHDFGYSYNEPLVKKYFFHQDYNNYPVVGINLKQAIAFCQWKTKQVNGNIIVRLPTFSEWESAALGQRDSAALFDLAKPYSCNFGPVVSDAGAIIKNYDDDGFFYTNPVNSFPATDFGLYNMKGNVAEWTSTSLDAITNIEVIKKKQKQLFIVKGGGWNSTPYYLQPGACQFYDSGSSNTWTGFRYVVSIVRN